MAASLDMFAYLAAFVTVVLALALGDMVQSLHRLLRVRAKVRWTLIGLLAALACSIAILEEFFALCVSRAFESVHLYALLCSSSLRLCAAQ